jgi:hypothetical protein
MKIHVYLHLNLIITVKEFFTISHGSEFCKLSQYFVNTSMAASFSRRANNITGPNILISPCRNFFLLPQQ